MRINRDAARRFLLRKNGLLGERQFEGEAGTLSFIRQAGCIQYDPIDACGRNADLVLQSRIKGYRPSMLASLLYDKRQLVDYWDKNMAIFSVEDWPCFARTRAAYASSNLRSYDQVEAQAPAVREMLQKLGPSFSDDLNLRHKVDWYWSETTVARAVLEALYFRGELGIHRKRGTQKAYDFARNLLPGEILDAPDLHPDEKEYTLWRIKRRIGGVGMLWNKASDAFLCIENNKAEARNMAFETLQSRGEILPLLVDEIGEPLYILAEDEPLLCDVMAGKECEPRTQVIAPLDNMLWDRRLIEALFDFSYRWEIYTPKEQRKYGYYVLPVLQGDSFVGRIELNTNRREHRLEVKGFWPEKGKKPGKRALQKCIREFADFQEVEEVTWLV